ncbi:hypothetical protein RB597_009494 [Gaeumannomyces tritici]
MADAEINLSNGDVWDDSALIDSWNQALDEYKKYHSIYAGKSKGLQPSSPSHRPPAASTASAPGPEAADVPESQKKPSENRLDAKTETNKVPTVPGTRETSAGKETTGSVADPNGVANARIAPPPEALIGSEIPVGTTVQDEGLKSMLMAWYYAGYYTGLYEGQQKAPAQQEQ